MGRKRHLISDEYQRGHRAYTEELWPTLDELASYGPHMLFDFMLSEVVQARATIAVKEPGRLARSDALLTLVNACRADESEHHHAELKHATEELGNILAPDADNDCSGRDAAIWQYEEACIYLAKALSDGKMIRLVAQQLIAFKGIWTTHCSFSKARGQQLVHLRAMLGRVRQSAQQPIATSSRSRNSLLAD